MTLLADRIARDCVSVRVPIGIEWAQVLGNQCGRYPGQSQRDCVVRTGCETRRRQVVAVGSGVPECSLIGRFRRTGVSESVSADLSGGDGLVGRGDVGGDYGDGIVPDHSDDQYDESNLGEAAQDEHT